MVAASEFDTDMRERKVPKNRMVDTLECFEEIFTLFPEEDGPDVILFLNKMDQFKEKIKAGKSITECPALEGYDGDGSLESMCDFIGGKFLERIPQAQKREVYVKPTTATDIQQMAAVLKVVTAAGMRKNMRAAYEEW